MDNRVLLVLLLRHDDRSKPTMAETGFMGNPAFFNCRISSMCEFKKLARVQLPLLKETQTV